MKLGKAAGPSEANMDMIMASGKFGVGVLKKLCQRVLDGKGMPEEWKTSVVVPIFKGKLALFRVQCKSKLRRKRWSIILSSASSKNLH